MWISISAVIVLFIGSIFCLTHCSEDNEKSELEDINGA